MNTAPNETVEKLVLSRHFGPTEKVSGYAEVPLVSTTDTW